MVRRSVGIRPIPTWVRGPAFVDGDEIGLIEKESETYQAFTPDHCEHLLSDIAQLANPTRDAADPLRIVGKRASGFAEEHGLLWHGPNQDGSTERRESLAEWFIAGAELQISVALCISLRQSLKEGSAELVRRYLRASRDVGFFRRLVFPDDDDALLEFASIQLSERITRGMERCTPTLLAGCSLISGEGEKVGRAGDFFFGNDPGSLVGAANYALASLISRKEAFLNCEGCGRMFRPEHGSQRFCCPACNERHRKRRQRELKSKGSPAS